MVHPLYQQTLSLHNHPTSVHSDYRNRESLPPARSKDTTRVMRFVILKHFCCGLGLNLKILLIDWYLQCHPLC